MARFFRFVRPPRASRLLFLLGVGLGLGLAFTATACLSFGRMVVRIDPLAPADVIYVLGGSRVDRWAAGYELYRAGYAPLILLSPGGREAGQVALARQGVHVPDEADIARQVLIEQLGVPPAHVEILDRPVDNTADEALAIAPRARAAGWRRIIVIASRAASRRAGYAFRRELEGVEIIVRAPPFDDYDPSRWWARRDMFRATFYELPKLVAYRLGLRGVSR